MINSQNNKAERKKKEKSKVLYIVMFLIVCAAIGVLIGILSETYLKNFMDAHIKSENGLIELLKIYVLLLIIILGYFIHIIIHETGHFIFGLMTGYTFVSFRIGSFTLIEENKKLKYKKFNIPGTAGQCLMMPPDFNNGKYPFVIYNLGGVIMNLIVSLGGFLLVIFINKIAFPVDAILVLLSIGGIFAIITNGIPMKVGGVPNDGYNVVSMFKDQEAKRGFHVQLETYGLLTKGRRIKDLPLEIFKLKDQSDLYNPLNASIRLMEYTWYLDNMDFDSAKKCINSFTPYIDNMMALLKYEVNCERMFIELIDNCDKTFIDKLYDKNLKKYIKAAKFMIGKKRLLMAYEAFYNNDKNKALVAYEETVVLAKKYPVKGEAEMELMLIDWIKNKLDSKQ